MREVGAGEYGLTFLGAWRAAYRLLPPFKQARVRRRSAGAQRLRRGARIACPGPTRVTITARAMYAAELSSHPLALRRELP